MKLNFQKKLAGKVLSSSTKRVKFDTDRLEDIKQAITKSDVKSLISDGAITEIAARSNSRGRARKRQLQRSKGLQKGPGKRQGKAGARAPRKETWVKKIRVQRRFLKELKDTALIGTTAYRNLYMKAKGGFFRSKNHIKIYMTEHNLFDKKE